MATQATYDDVNLILKLFEVRREEKLREARAFMTGKFKASTLEEMNQICPPGSTEHAYFRMTVGYWDMVASFVTAGVLNADLLFQSTGELAFTYEKIRELTPQIRAAMNYQALAANMEKVADAYLEWLDSRSRGAAAAFQARAKGM